MERFKNLLEQEKALNNKPVEVSPTVGKEESAVEAYLTYFEEYAASKKIRVEGHDLNRQSAAAEIVNFIADNKLTEDKMKSFIRYCVINWPRYGSIISDKMFLRYTDKNKGGMPRYNNQSTFQKGGKYIKEEGPMAGTSIGSKEYWDAYWLHYDSSGRPKTDEAMEYEKSINGNIEKSVPSTITLEDIRKTIKEAF